MELAQDGDHLGAQAEVGLGETGKASSLMVVFLALEFLAQSLNSISDATAPRCPTTDQAG
jgi:hypothetical protein